MSDNPVDVLARIFGNQAALAKRFGLVPQTVSNWKTLGIPAAQKWVISRELRAMRERHEISDVTFLEAIEALEANSSPSGDDPRDCALAEAET